MLKPCAIIRIHSKRSSRHCCDLQNTSPNQIISILCKPQGEERSLRTLVDLGSGVHCAALVPDTSRIFIRAGLGFHVECDLAIDAPRVIALQKASLKAQLERCLSTIASVRANIRATADGIEQLRRLQR